LQRIDDAVNSLISPDPLRREFLGHERLVVTLFDAVKPDQPRWSSLVASAAWSPSPTSSAPHSIRIRWT